jgi:signal transduction histidine kinase/CheY-like chemotaxis protein
MESNDIFQFSIPLPFYRSYWFYTAVILLLFIIIMIYVNVRSRRLKGIELERLVKERTAELQQEIVKREKLGEALLIAKEAAEESSNMKSALLANMSHELRTPMNGILGFSELLRDNITDEDQKVMANHILKSGERLMYTLNTVLDLAMLESGNLQIFNKNIKLADIVNKIIDPYLPVLQSKSIILTINNPEGLQVCSDGKIIERIISSLFDNAIKFTIKGSITITSKEFYKESNRWISILVEDTGLGIPRDKYDIIFKEFRQVSEGYGRSQEGIGLGLSLSLKMALLIGGNIILHSELNKGSTFELVFPECQESKNEQKGAVKQNTPLLSHSDDETISVLVVEDNIVNINLIISYIPDNYDVVVTHNGYQAVKRAEEQNFQLILMDINLGPGMNGIETLNEIKKIKNYKDVPFIAVTGYSDIVLQSSENAQLFDGIITKPFSKNELMDIINGLFNV